MEGVGHPAHEPCNLFFGCLKLLRKKWQTNLQNQKSRTSALYGGYFRISPHYFFKILYYIVKITRLDDLEDRKSRFWDRSEDRMSRWWSQDNKIGSWDHHLEIQRKHADCWKILSWRSLDEGLEILSAEVLSQEAVSRSWCPMLRSSSQDLETWCRYLEIQKSMLYVGYTKSSTLEYYDKGESSRKISSPELVLSMKMTIVTKVIQFIISRPKDSF